MNWRAYARLYVDCFRLAFPTAFASLWIPSSIATIGFAAVFPFLGPFNMAMNILTGLVPLAIFAAIMVAGPLFSAFRMVLERDERISALERQLAKKTDTKGARARFGQLIEDGLRLCANRPFSEGEWFLWQDTSQEWLDNCQQAITDAFDSAEATAVFTSHEEVPLRDHSHQEHKAMMRKIDLGIAGLRRLLDKLPHE